MATVVRTPTVIGTDATGISNVEMWVWVIDGDDTGLPVKFAKHSDKTVQIDSASFGTATVVLEGSNDLRADPNHADHANAVWLTLTDPQGNAISKTANSVETVMENTLWVRPKATGDAGDALTINVRLLGRR
jgi:hypothetical protein